jgi:hypothetical protein
MARYQRLHLTKREEWLALLSSYFTPATIVQGIKEHLGLSTRTYKRQPAIDRNAAADIGVPAKVRTARDE